MSGMVFSFIFSETVREDKQLWTYYSLGHDTSIFHNICRNYLLMPAYVAGSDAGDRFCIRNTTGILPPN